MSITNIIITINSLGSQGFGLEPSKDHVRSNIRFCKDHCNSNDHKRLGEFCMLRNKYSVCPVYLLEPTPGMHCPFASGLGTNISSASSLLAPVLAVWFWFFSAKWLTWKSSHNLATMISAARDLNELGGKHRLLQTPSQPTSKWFWNSVNLWNNPVSLTWKNETFITTHVHF